MTENNSNIPEKFLKPYDSKNTEDRIYKQWEKSGYFNPDICIEKGVTKKDAEHFSMVLPPPNVTGRLHLGHVLEHSLQDTLIRFHRMAGKKTLWIPGTDHAAIATQSRYEKDLYSKDKKSRHDFSRDDFFKQVHQFGLNNQKDMQNQMRLIGSSLDWSREAFTLDEKRSLAVKMAFKKMYEDGLIYRGFRVVNWDPKGQTTISDDEIVYEEREAILYTFRYSKDFPVPISTTRPETKLGDTAVAVHPEDERYKEFIGKEYSIEFLGVPLKIKVIGDRSVQPEFGTGALGVTPAHSTLDYDIAIRHNLPLKQVINEYGKMMVGGDDIENKKTSEARLIVAEKIRKEGLMIAEEDIKQNLSIAERTGGIIEPLPKLQWFVNVNKEIKDPVINNDNASLKDLMRESVASGKIQVVPEQFEKIYFNWIENLHDWCISRQIIYGHRIPVWYRKEEICVGIEAPEGEGWEQDPDTLDTWFSSALWSFSTLGWPHFRDAASRGKPGQENDLANYHPTTFINPGYEILFFWVARMIMMSRYIFNEVPFKTVLLHGIVRDKAGKKFSKSMKNGIEPEIIIDQYGTDALRMSMIVGTPPGSDLNFDVQKVKAYKNFANKLWNISRFVISSTEDFNSKNVKLTENDQGVIDELNKLTEDITNDLKEYRTHLAAEKLYHYVWHNFADIILEECKKNINDGSDGKSNSQYILIEILNRILKLLHPFMPFITEEIWQSLDNKFKKYNDREFIMISPWPKLEY